MPGLFTDIFGSRARHERDDLLQKLNEQFLVHQKLLVEHKNVCEELAKHKSYSVPPLLLQQQEIIGNGIRYLEQMTARLKRPGDNNLRHALLEYDLQRFLAVDRASGRIEVNPDARPLILVLDMDLDSLTLLLTTVGPAQVAGADFSLTVGTKANCTVGAALFEDLLGMWVQEQFFAAHPWLKILCKDNGVHACFRPIAERLFVLLCLGAPHGKVEEIVIFDTEAFRAVIELQASELASLFRSLIGPEGALIQEIRKLFVAANKSTAALDRIVCLGMFCRLPILRLALNENFDRPVLCSEIMPTVALSEKTQCEVNSFTPSQRPMVFEKIIKSKPNQLTSQAEAANHFTALENAILDTRTGLIWCANCNYGGQAMDWHGANLLIKTSKVGGMIGWRLPAKEEIEMMVNYAGSSSPIRFFEKLGFKNIYSSDGSCYWTSTSVNNNSNQVWVVELFSGKMKKNNKYLASNFVWSVRYA